MVLETKDGALGVLISTGVPLSMNYLSWQSKEIYVHILTPGTRIYK